MREDTFADVIGMLPAELRREVNQITGGNFSEINELRMRTGQTCSYKSASSGRIIRGNTVIDNKMLNECINKFINYSYYAYEEELKNGYITLFGGHRAGVCGRAVIEKGKVSLLSDISSVNIRHAKEYRGVAAEFMRDFVRSSDMFPNTLVVSPPGCGKTTFIRDMVRILSTHGYNVGVCDERSEIAGMHRGVPSFDIGPNTDVLDSCPKAEGMRMLLRSMAPDIIVTDEIGRPEDIDALKAALIAGTGIIATVHGNSMDDLKHGALEDMIREKIFRKIVFLSRVPKPCTVRETLSAK